MKILLTTLNAKYVHSNLALKYLYKACESLQEDISVREFTINNTDDYIYMELMRGEYHIIGFSCYIWNIERILYLVKILKKARPETIILLGGPEVSFDPKKLLEDNPAVDYILSGEGEATLPALLQEIIRSEEQSNSPIPGVTLRRDVQIISAPPGKPMDVEQVDFPYQGETLPRDKILYYETSRGCPFRCSYCLSSISKELRFLPLERVKRELMFFIQQNVKQVKFIDRTFNADRRRCSEILQFLSENDNGITNFHFELCGDLIDEELLKIVGSSRKGLFQFEIGVQSTNIPTLEACNRHTSFEKMQSNVKGLMETGKTHVHLDLIAGLPFETYAAFRKSFNDVYALKPDALQLGFLKVLKGTAIRDSQEYFEYIYREAPPYEVICNRFISAQELVLLKMIENVFDLWYNRGGFSRIISYLETHGHNTPFDFFQSLGEFYYHHGYQNASHKKEDLYRILYHFAEKHGCHEEVKPLLEADMDDTLNMDAVKRFKKKGWQLK